MPLSGPPNASPTLNHASIRVLLLNKEELLINIENKNVRVGDLFSKACEHVGLKETEYFGLAQQRDGEFQFLQSSIKLQKLASKLWKSKNLHNDKPLLTFYLRVQYYVDNIGLLKDRTTRQQYYLQLRDNLLNYGQTVSEEKCFILASYALQTDFGPYKPDSHVGAYFDPREYFPAWVVMRRGQDYITNNLPVMHKDLASMTPAEACVVYIRELSSVPMCHNCHFYRLRRRKYDSTATVWLAICPKGLQIHEEANGFKNLLSVFPWQNIAKIHCDKKKFEIATDPVSERKFTYYTMNKEWGDHLFDLCRSTHRLHMALQPRLAEMQHQEEHDQRYQEMYVHSGNYRSSQGRRYQMATPERWPKVTSVESPFGSSQSPALAGHSGLSTVPEDVATMTPNFKVSEEEEIMIDSPPMMSSTFTTVSPMSDVPQSSILSYTSEQLNQTALSGSDNGRNFQHIPSFGSRTSHQDAGSFTSRPTFQLSSKPTSSLESLTAGSYSNSNSPSVHRIHTSLTSSPSSALRHDGSGRDDAKSWMASPVNSVLSWRSASPNSSAGSGQLVFSLPQKQKLVDAASLRKSLPHGKTLNEYISQIISGEETKIVTAVSSQNIPRRKSSLDQQQTYLLSSTGDMTRSVSLRHANDMLLKIQQSRNLDAVKNSYKNFQAEDVGNVQQNAVSSLMPVQPLPQVPVAAQVQKIIFPEKMTAISTSVKLEPSRSMSGQFPKTYLPEKSGNIVYQPFHSTPLPSRYQIHSSGNVPMSYGIPGGNTVTVGYDPLQTVPNFAFPVTPVISTLENDYFGKYTPSTVEYTQAIATGLSVFDQPPLMTSSPRLTSESLPLTRLDPPPYHEWQAAQAMAALNISTPPERKQPMMVMQPAEEMDRKNYFPALQMAGPVAVTDENVQSFYRYLNTPNTTSISGTTYQMPVSATFDVMDSNSQSKGPQMTKTPSTCNDVPASSADAAVGRLGEKYASTSASAVQPPVTKKPDSEVATFEESDPRKNIREKIRNFETSDLPMLNALLTDKSLLNYQLTDQKADSSRTLRHTGSAVARPVSWHSEHHQLLSNGKLSYMPQSVETEAVNKSNGHVGKVIRNGTVNKEQLSANGLWHHSSADSARISSAYDVVAHHQSHSDTGTLMACSPVVSKC